VGLIFERENNLPESIYAKGRRYFLVVSPPPTAKRDRRARQKSQTSEHPSGGAIGMNKAILAHKELMATASLLHAARAVSAQAFERAGDYDEDYAYPTADIGALKDARLLTATLPLAFGGVGVGGVTLCEILRQIGSGACRSADYSKGM
jgi:hypothetical protein